ncbi:hypothetical protein KAR91_28490 [Candidatus Pacearchaeota archaeon]|nr:hypothetical protein [Candidatus Pacearchaeota archaeon]
MAVVGLAFAGDNVLDDVPFLFHVAVFCIIWALFSWLTIDWSMIIEKEELE